MTVSKSKGEDCKNDGRWCADERGDEGECGGAD